MACGLRRSLDSSHRFTETSDMARTGADLIIETLKAAGVRRIYGVVGKFAE